MPRELKHISKGYIRELSIKVWVCSSRPEFRSGFTVISASLFAAKGIKT